MQFHPQLDGHDIQQQISIKKHIKAKFYVTIWQIIKSENNSKQKHLQVVRTFFKCTLLAPKNSVFYTWSNNKY